MKKKGIFSTFVLVFVLITLIFMNTKIYASSDSLEVAAEIIENIWAFKPDFKKDKNIIDLVESILEKEGFTDVKVSLKEAVTVHNNAASIDKDGTLNYHFIDPNKDTSAANMGLSNLRPVFILEKAGEKLETGEVTVQLRWDEYKVFNLLKKEVDNYFENGLNEIISPNENAQSIISNFNLPKALNGKAWLNATWTSSSNKLKIGDVEIGLDSNDRFFSHYPVKVEQATKDEIVKLTLKVNFNKSGGEHISYEKEFDLLIPRSHVDLAELKKEMQAEIDGYFNEHVLKYASPYQDEPFDAENVRHDIILPNSGSMRRNKKDSSGNIISVGIKDLYKKYVTSGKGFSFFKVEDIYAKEEGVGAKITGSRLNVSVPKDGEEPHRLRLTMTLKHKDYDLEVSKYLDLLLVPSDYDVLKVKIAHYNKLMTLAKDNIFTALNNNPKNEKNEGPYKIVNDLSMFKEIRFKNPDKPEDNTLEFIYNAKDIVGDGIAPSPLEGWEMQEAYRLAKSSHPEFLSHENLRVNRPEKDTDLTLEIKLTTPIMEEYKNYFVADDKSQVKNDLAALFDQNIKLDLTILGEVKEDNTEVRREDISDDKLGGEIESISPETGTNPHTATEPRIDETDEDENIVTKKEAEISLSEVSKNAVFHRGDFVEIELAYLKPFEKVKLELHSKIIKLGEEKADNIGTLKFKFKVPAEVRLGAHDIVVIREDMSQLQLGINIIAHSTGKTETRSRTVISKSADNKPSVKTKSEQVVAKTGQTAKTLFFAEVILFASITLIVYIRSQIKNKD